MKSNARCWTPPAAAPLIAMLWLSACAMAGSDGPATCPPVVDYSQTVQAKVDAEIMSLPEHAALVGWLSDYAVMREQSRRCAGQGR